MCQRIILILLVLNAAVVAIAVAAFVHFEWWQAILVIVASIAALALAARYLLRYAFHHWTERIAALANAGGIVLRNATVQVHSVESADPPRKLDDDDEFDTVDDDTRAQIEADLFGKNWYRIELTVFPNPDIDESTKPWDPNALYFLPFETESKESWLLRDDAIPFEKLKLMNPGNQEETRGPQRLLILAGIPKELYAVSLGYFGERFGCVRLPGVFERRKALRP